MVKRIKIEMSQMDDPKARPTTNETPSTTGKLYSILVPAVIGIVITKLLGLVGGLITVGLYFILRPKMGALAAAVISAIIGAAAAVLWVSINKA
jgi:uncharacterized membrane protein YeaQ/YmgE (transglycosylase-associated protein family)